MEALKLPPLPEQEPQLDLRAEQLAPAPLALKQPSHVTQQVERQNRSTHTLLIFSVIALVTFVAGVALASTLLLGILDLNSGWLKDVLDTVKDLARHKTS